MNAKDDVKTTMAVCASGLPETRECVRGRRHAPILTIPDVQGRGHNLTHHCLWETVEKASTAVASAKE